MSQRTADARRTTVVPIRPTPPAVLDFHELGV